MEAKPLTPIKAIRKHCLNCQGNHPSLVRTCDTVECYLHPYRLGRSIGRKGIGGFKTHRKNLSVTGLGNSSMPQGNHATLADTQPMPKAKPFITEEMAKKMIQAANIIIDTTNTLKPSA